MENLSTDNDLLRECEVGNDHDTHAVAVRKNIIGETTTMGHIPQKISSIPYVQYLGKVYSS